MKRLLAAALTLFLCAAPAAQAADVDLLRTLYAQRGQTVVSPLSLNLAIAMAAEGAKGETRSQLLAAAGLTEEGLAAFAGQARALGKSGAAVANAAFIKEGFPVLEAYKGVLADRYAAEIFGMDIPGVNDAVNAWVKEKTGGLIEKLLDQPPDPDLAMMLVNALSFKADWSAPFDAYATGKGTFHAPGGDVEADFLNDTRYLPYASLPGMRAVRLNYADSELGLTVILPDGSVSDALTQLSASPVDWKRALADRAEVSLSLPKLSCEDSLSLIDALKAMGVSDAFDDRADFSGIDGAQDLYIGSVVQKTRLIIDEQGTTAAAATGIGMEAMAAPNQELPIEFTVDRPYILLLTDEATGLTLFAAAIDRP